MPLEKSHVIVICSVSPLVIGLAAYYWYHSRKNHVICVQEDNLELTCTAKTDIVADLSDTGLITDSTQESEMTRQRRSMHGQAISVIDSTSISEGQQIPLVSLKSESSVKPQKPPEDPSAPENLQNVQPVAVSGSDSEDLFHHETRAQEDVVDDELTSLNNVQSDHSGSEPGSHGARVESNFSDTHTEVSADSGLGVNNDSIVFKFDFPSDLVGLLIGNHGRNVKMLQEKSGARVRIERSHFTSQYQVCVVEGSSHCVDVALELIRDRFPTLDLSQLTSEPSPALDMASAPVPIPQLRIPQHTMSDVCISSIVSAAHLYLQQPTHPYFRELEVLTQQMNAVYSDFSAPLLPEQIPVGVICAAPWIDQIAFCRALILSVNDTAGTCQVRYVDHGSTVELPVYSLRQIRSDFLRLPFQATECYLSNLAPAEGQEDYSADAAAFLQKVTEGCVLLCWVHGFAQDGKPLVELYLRHGTQKVSVNKLLVENGFAKWIDSV